MIARLTGQIVEQQTNELILDVQGVGYLVAVSMSTLNQIKEINGDVSLLIEMIVREDAITLYGFYTQEEKSAFNLLQSVQGVGAKTALNTLSIFTPSELESIISSEDKTSLTQIPGIGMRGAGRICSELKDKILQISPLAVNTAKNKDIEDLISGLTSLGYNQNETYNVLSKMSSDDKNKKLEEMIQIALKLLAER